MSSIQFTLLAIPGGSSIRAGPNRPASWIHGILRFHSSSAYLISLKAIDPWRPPLQIVRTAIARRRGAPAGLLAGPGSPPLGCHDCRCTGCRWWRLRCSAAGRGLTVDRSDAADGGSSADSGQRTSSRLYPSAGVSIVEAAMLGAPRRCCRSGSRFGVPVYFYGAAAATRPDQGATGRCAARSV